MYVPRRTGGEFGEQGPLWAGSMEELLGPGVSGAPDRPSLALHLHAQARTGPAASFSLGESASPRPSGAQAWFRGSLGSAQLGSRCRKLKRQEREGEAAGKREEERKGGRREGGRRERTGQTGTASPGSGTSSRGLLAWRGCRRMVQMT